jgi:AcrR family transcriptional regulator
MVQISHSGENIEKIDIILQVAQKRFGLYGFEKTSMKEISSDLGMSKGSLYYYFPDKEHLYKAIVEKEQKEFLDELDKKINRIDDPKEMLREYVEVRFKYFKSLLNLSRFSAEEFAGFKPIVKESLKLFKDSERDFIRNIFKKGSENSVFQIKNLNKITSLYLDLLQGLRFVSISNKRTLYLDQEEYNALVEKAVRFTEIFINGLK